MSLRLWFRGFLSAWWLAACLVCLGKEGEFYKAKAWSYGLFALGITVWTYLEYRPSPTDQGEKK